MAPVSYGSETVDDPMVIRIASVVGDRYRRTMLEHISQVVARHVGFTFCFLRSHDHGTTQVPVGDGTCTHHIDDPHITFYMGFMPDRNEFTHEGHVLVEYITINGVKMLKGIPVQGKSMLLWDRETRELAIL
ncbi:uncharacterized protein ASPGLDRAFT_31269 [Aspergillus glaucus CBS 516.65]|uniref:Uncharacterized protein n=1 Tax=Aspergillus glaucus CBS 516.65 TaxID=1160497 RepID=A0A1L9W0C1_ASPGL|nr:hypothetical protein ASPGLDRAFT_31269 [Aspergillus glaucus CBS 516.65]OJJ89589.1 hypothetical protein ASPGLDRAFT_31269 [Aspergillus glaucus CBS 516.65]